VVLFAGNWARLRGAAAMADGDRTSDAARHIFDAHVRLDRSLDSVDRLGPLLPRDRAVLRGLEALCLNAARAAMKDGHHTEGRRFGTLARQLRKLSEGLPRQGDSGRR
jgi:hypothetical protein